MGLSFEIKPLRHVHTTIDMDRFSGDIGTLIAGKKAEHKDPEEKEDDRVNGNLEGEHGDRPASDTAIILWGMTGSQPGSTPCR